ncbi:biopolymer transporter ExbD [Aurantibacter sp.]|uniref:ExbD/TolR family protein n=1 Tax=Aurantibacter sp. TaxID=2807103 RepID=UPI003264D5AC
MGKRESVPQVNAGSMADIAFLLLIFFLVTTTIESDVGIQRILPREDGDVIHHNQRNILSILLNHNGELLIDDAPIGPSLIKKTVIDFIDNGGGQDDSICDYCKGKRRVNSSENPKKAVVVLNAQRETEYGVYIAVQNEIVAAYNHLRNREANRMYNMNYTMMDSLYRNSKTTRKNKDMFGVKIKTIQKMYPINITEAELKNQ